MNERNLSSKHRLALLFAMLLYLTAVINLSLCFDRQTNQLLRTNTTWVFVIGMIAIIVGFVIFGWFSLQKWALRQGGDSFSCQAAKVAELQQFGIILLIWGVAFCAGNTFIGWLVSIGCCVLLIVQQWDHLKQIGKFGESDWRIGCCNIACLFAFLIVSIYVVLTHNAACVTITLLIAHARLAEKQKKSRLLTVLKKCRRFQRPAASRFGKLARS